jgi:hypothetical protein
MRDECISTLLNLFHNILQLQMVDPLLANSGKSVSPTL